MSTTHLRDANKSGHLGTPPWPGGHACGALPSVVTDWQAWHDDYDDPTSSLARRLAVVRRRLAEVLEQGSVRTVLSLCAGDGRDLVPVVAALPADRRPDIVLCELDPTLADRARQRVAEAGLRASVVVGDAALVANWRSSVPVDLLMLCGIFGNVSDDDVRTTVRAAPAFLNPGGAVIWTRGHREGVDVRPQIRSWFVEAGFEEVAFDAETVGYGVGVHRLRSAAAVVTAPERLFTFLR